MKLLIIQPQCFLFPLFYYACNCQKYIIYKQKTKDVLFKLGVSMWNRTGFSGNNIIPQA